MQQFASYGGNVEDEIAYAEQYVSITTAHAAYTALSSEGGIDAEQMEYSLPILLILIKNVMMNDKEKFQEVFQEFNTSSLIYNIADNFEDKESINKINKLLGE